MPKAVKNARLKKVQKLQSKVLEAHNLQQIGKKCIVLCESVIEPAKYYVSRREQNSPEVDTLVYIKTDRILKPGEFYKIKNNQYYRLRPRGRIIMNIPNKLTFLRIFLIPVMMFFYLLDSFQFGKIVAALIFIIAIITDLLDGHIARKYNMVTDLGKFLDPIADKLLVTASLLLLITDGTIPAPYGVIALFIILSRDFIVGVLRQMAATKRNVIAADNLGKNKNTIPRYFNYFYIYYGV